MEPRIITSPEGITAEQLAGGFWEHWPNPPSPERHLELLHASTAVAIAVDEDEHVVGFATAIGDGVLSAYIPLLEVLPEHRGSGLGTRLVETIIDAVSPCYMIDTACDDNVVPFYERLGFMRGNAMARRDYASQSGIARDA